MRLVLDTNVLVSGAIVVNWPRRDVPDSIRAAVVERLVAVWSRYIPEPALRELVKVGDVPRTLPHYFGLHADACDRLWVLRTPVELDLVVHWEVFSAAGAPLGPVTLPLRTSAIAAWGVGRSVLAVIAEDDTGSRTLRLWKVPTTACATPPRSPDVP